MYAAYGPTGLTAICAHSQNPDSSWAEQSSFYCMRSTMESVSGRFEPQQTLDLGDP